MICPFCEYELSDSNYIGITRCSNCSRAFSVYYAEGKQLLKNEIYDQAISNFLNALKFFKNTALLHLDLAYAYKKVGNDDDYQSAIDRAKEIDPELSETVIESWEI